MLILAILAAGMAIGAVAQFILGRDGERTDWTMALFAGIGGSFVGGLIFNLIGGDGFDITVSGVIGTLVGALIITAIWQWYAKKKKSESRAAAKAAARSGRHH